jgi:diguanylate cyclase (GGDEF)-like protein
MTSVRAIGRDRLLTAALIGLVLFAMAFIWFVRYAQSIEAQDARVVTAAARQIERSHRLSTSAVLLGSGLATEASEIRSLLDILNRTHHALRFGDRELNMPGAGNAEAIIKYTELDATYREMTVAAQMLLDDATDPDALSALLSNAETFEMEMAEIGTVLEQEAATRTNLFNRLEIGTIALGFIITVGVVLVIGPTGRRRQVAAAASRAARNADDVDHLTGLPRRGAVRDHLVGVLDRRRRDDDLIGLLMVGIEEPSERDGDHTSDRVIQESARALRGTLRSTDLIGRVGRNQFAILLGGLHRAEDAGRVAAKVLDALHEVGDEEARVMVVASAGIAVAPMDADAADELLQRAMLALQAARSSGGATYRYYSPEVRTAANGTLQLSERLRVALDLGKGLRLAYQPKIRLTDGAVVGAEALARWSDDELGDVEPLQFIPVAEQSDLILHLGAWVIDEACRQIALWESEGISIPVSVNVSPRQLRQGDLDDVVAAALARHGIAASQLELEITEAVLLEEKERPLYKIRSLRGLGVRISVDDFGTGYSALSYLKRFPIDTLKIDQSFIREMSEGSNDAAISTAIIALAHSLDLDVVAEGIETDEQLWILQDLGCDIGQGFLFARPMPPGRVAAFTIAMTQQLNAYAADPTNDEGEEHAPDVYEVNEAAAGEYPPPAIVAPIDEVESTTSPSDHRFRPEKLA